MAAYVTVMQESSQASHPHAVQRKDRMISTLTAQQKIPGKERNVESMLNAIKAGQIPYGHKPVLYAIGGKASLATVTEFGEDLKNKLKQDPNVDYLFYVRG